MGSWRVFWFGGYYLAGERLNLSSAYTLALILVMVNVMLFVGGYATKDTLPTTSRLLKDLNVSDFRSSSFQQSMIVKDENGTSMASFGGSSFIVGVLDFLQSIPILGPLISIARIIYEMLGFLAFGAVGIAIKMQLPSIIVIPLGILFYGVSAIAMFEFLKEFMSSRGGTK